MPYDTDAAFLPSWGDLKQPQAAGNYTPGQSADNLKDTSSTLSSKGKTGCLQSLSCAKPTKSRSQNVTATKAKQGSLYGTGYGSAPFGGKRKIWQFPDSNITAMIIFLPFLAFLIIALCFLKYWKFGWIAHVFILLVVGASLACCGVGGLIRKGRYEDNKCTDQFLVFLGGFCLLCAALGIGVGFTSFYQYTKPYEIAVASRYYENVMPSENPGAKRDASMVQFASGGHVESTKGLGYRDGNLYCVAPIFGVNTGNFVGYWAAGQDCCDARGSFRCDDVLDENAHGGVVIDPLPQYMDAAAQAASQYDLSIPAHPVFIKWSADVHKVVNGMQSDGRTLLLNATFCVFLMCLVVGLILAIIHGKKLNGSVDRLYSIGPADEGTHKPDKVALLKEQEAENDRQLQMITETQRRQQEYEAAREAAMRQQIQRPLDFNTSLPGNQRDAVTIGPDDEMYQDNFMTKESKESEATNPVAYDPEALLPEGNINLDQDPFMSHA